TVLPYVRLPPRDARPAIDAPARWASASAHASDQVGDRRPGPLARQPRARRPAGAPRPPSRRGDDTYRHSTSGGRLATGAERPSRADGHALTLAAAGSIPAAPGQGAGVERQLVAHASHRRGAVDQGPVGDRR